MGLITHLIVRLTSDLGPQLAATALSLATACAIVGRYAVATVAEHGRRRAGAVSFLVQAVGVALLVVGTSASTLLAGSLLFGLGIGNMLSLPPLILQSEQRAIDVGRSQALLSAICQVVFAFGPGAIGLLRDATGGYAQPFAVAGCLLVVSAVVVVADGVPGRRNTTDG